MYVSTYYLCMVHAWACVICMLVVCCVRRIERCEPSAIPPPICQRIGTPEIETSVHHFGVLHRTDLVNTHSFPPYSCLVEPETDYTSCGENPVDLVTGLYWALCDRFLYYVVLDCVTTSPLLVTEVTAGGGLGMRLTVNRHNFHEAHENYACYAMRIILWLIRLISFQTNFFPLFCNDWNANLRSFAFSVVRWSIVSNQIVECAIIIGVK